MSAQGRYFWAKAPGKRSRAQPVLTQNLPHLNRRTECAVQRRHYDTEKTVQAEASSLLRHYDTEKTVHAEASSRLLPTSHKFTHSLTNSGLHPGRGFVRGRDELSRVSSPSQVEHFIALRLRDGCGLGNQGGVNLQLLQSRSKMLDNDVEVGVV